jgi:hypothetical protein
MRQKLIFGIALAVSAQSTTDLAGVSRGKAARLSGLNGPAKGAGSGQIARLREAWPARGDEALISHSVT